MITGSFVLYFAWISIIEIGIAIYLLYLTLGLASIAPAVVFHFATIETEAMTKAFPRLQKIWVEEIQTRVFFTSTMLSPMKSIKLPGISNVVKRCQRLWPSSVSRHSPLLAKGPAVRTVVTNVRKSVLVRNVNATMRNGPSSAIWVGSRWVC